MPKKIHTEGLDELVAQGVTVVIAQDTVILQVAGGNELGATLAEAYILSCSNHQEKDQIIIPRKVPAVNPGNLNFSLHWGHFTEFITSGNDVRIKENGITLNYHQFSRKITKDLYDFLKDNQVEVEMFSYENIPLPDFAAILAKVAEDKPMFMAKRSDNMLEILVEDTVRLDGED